MPRIIVSIAPHDGSVISVRSDSPYPARAVIVECGDPNIDPQGAALTYQANHGGLQEHLGRTGPQAGSPPKLNLQVLELVQNWSIYEEGRKQQMMAAAFIDGYLASHAEVVQYLTGLAQEDGPIAAGVYRTMAPLLDMQDENYDQLCGKLNRPDIFDESAKIDADAPVAYQSAASGEVTLIQGLLGPLLAKYPGVGISSEESVDVLDYLELVGLSIAVDLRSGKLYSIPREAPSVAPATPISLESAVRQAFAICDHDLKRETDGRKAGLIGMDRKRLSSLINKIESSSKESTTHEAAI